MIWYAEDFKRMIVELNLRSIIIKKYKSRRSKYLISFKENILKKDFSTGCVAKSQKRANSTIFSEFARAVWNRFSISSQGEKEDVSNFV